jgi:hypothetical protein
MALGAILALITLIANLTLMAISGWFIAAMAAGAGGVSMNYFTPAALIRGILRTAGRYLERLVTHEATLRQLAGLRVWFYAHLELLAPAAQQLHSGDLLSRIRSTSTPWTTSTCAPWSWPSPPGLCPLRGVLTSSAADRPLHPGDAPVAGRGPALGPGSRLRTRPTPAEHQAELRCLARRHPGCLTPGLRGDGNTGRTPSA